MVDSGERRKGDDEFRTSSRSALRIRGVTKNGPAAAIRWLERPCDQAGLEILVDDQSEPPARE
jgi:hypothetical protein